MKTLINTLWGSLVFLGPSIIGGALVGAYPGYKAYEYAWKDARFCTSCHVHDYANVGWEQSIHGEKTTCHDCHHQPLRAYMNELYVMITKRPQFPRDLHHTPYVKQNLCAACHLSGPQDRSTLTGPMPIEEIKKIPKVDTSILHKLHLSKTTDLVLLNSFALSENERMANAHDLTLPKDRGESRQIGCADCHGGPTNRGHSFGAIDMSCTRCHESVHKNRFAKEFGCKSCHFQDFLAPVTSSFFEKQSQMNSKTSH